METKFISLDKCDLSIQNTIPTIDGVAQPITTILVLNNVDEYDIQDGSLVMELSTENAIRIISMLSESMVELMNKKESIHG